MTLRSLARGTLLITLANLVPRAGAFLLLPVYANFLSRSDFGTVSLASSAALLLAVVNRLGLDAALLRMHHDDDGAERRSLYATLVAVVLGAVLVVSVLAAALAALVVPDASTGVALLSVAIGATSTFQFVPSVWYRAREMAGRYLALALAAFGGVVAVTLALVVVARFGAVGSLLGQLAGTAVIAIVAGLIVWRQRPWRFRRDLARRGLAFGVPLLPHTVAGWLLNVSDRWMLGLLLGLVAAEALAAIGVYSLGYQLGYAIALIGLSFNAAWLPFLYRLAGNEQAPAILREATTATIAGFAGLAAMLAIVAPDLVALIAPPEWQPAADVAAVVAFASALNAAGLMLASGIYLSRDTRAMPLLTIGAAAVNVALNVVLIPTLGIMGAAWATLGAYLALAILIGAVARRRYPVGLDGARLAAVWAVAIGFSLLSRLAVAGGAANVAWHLVLAVAAAAAIAALLRAPLGRLRLSVAAADVAQGSRAARPLE